MLIDCISAFDPRDSSMSSAPKPSLVAAMKTCLGRPPRFAFVKTPAWPQAEPETQAAFEKFASEFGSKAEIVETALGPDFDSALRLQQIVQFTDIARNYGPIAEKHPHLMSQKLKAVPKNMYSPMTRKLAAPFSYRYAPVVEGQS